MRLKFSDVSGNACPQARETSAIERKGCTTTRLARKRHPIFSCFDIEQCTAAVTDTAVNGKRFWMQLPWSTTLQKDASFERTNHVW
jgi:hypothetical protein